MELIKQNDCGFWQKRLSGQFSTYRLNGTFADVLIRCSDGTVEAHKMILAGTSSWMKSLLLDCKEEVVSVQVDELTVDQVTTFLLALYGGCLPKKLETVINVCDLLVPDLVEAREVITKQEVTEKMEIEDRTSSSCTPNRDIKSKPELPIEKTVNKDLSNAANAVIDLKIAEATEKKPKNAALQMTKQERARKSAENLEHLCKFCAQPVLSHRVSLKVKQERNSSYHLKHQYVCCVCGTVVAAPSNFVHHNTVEHARWQKSGKVPSLWQFPCNHCNVTILGHRSKERDCLVCCHCKEEFSSPGVLTIHLKTVQSKDLVQCDVCALALPSSQLKSHHLTEHGDLVDSGAGKEVVENLQPQEVVVGTEKCRLVPCDACPDFVKASKKDKMAHYRDRHPVYHSLLLKHNNETWKAAPSSQYTFCDLCDKVIRRCNMKDHKLHSHEVDLKNEPVVRPNFTCDICGHVSKYAKDVKKHKKFVHEKILEHACRYCNKKFSNKGNLNQHEVVHTGVTPFQCDICGRQCRRKGELEKHIQSHHTYNSLLGTELDLAKPDPDPDPLALHPGHLLRQQEQHHLPLLLTQMDPETMRQADLLKDLSNQLGQQAGQAQQALKMPALIYTTSISHH